MTIGKREQIVIIAIGGLVVIFLVHLLIFKPRADEYTRVQGEYTTGMTLLQGAELAPSPNYVKNFNDKSKKYERELTSVVAELRLDTPPHYQKMNAQKRVSEIIDLLKQIMDLRTSTKQPQLTFLDDKRANPADPYSVQLGWNLTPQLQLSPELRVPGALWDTVVKLKERWDLKKAMDKPDQKLQQQMICNDLLRKIGLNPAEVSDYVAPVTLSNGQQVYVFFSDAALLKELVLSGGAQGGIDERRYYNPLSINRFGVLLPAFKKLWVSELVWQQRDKSTAITPEQLREIMEVNLPLGQTLLVSAKQLMALIDVLKAAEQNQILEISKVCLMKPVPVGKVSPRAGTTSGSAAATPTPAAPGPAMPTTFGGAMPTPATAAASGSNEIVGTGTGIELWFRGSNANIVKFLFDITHATGTYAVDDMEIAASPTGVLETSATIEFVTSLNNLK